VEKEFEIMTFGSDIMLNYNLFEKLKLIGRDKFNNLINNSTNLAFMDYMMIHIHYITCITNDKHVAQSTFFIHKLVLHAKMQQAQRSLGLHH
jgi:hypothetical protein